MTKSVVLYFPYILTLKAFVVTERLEDVDVDPTDLFLKANLNEEQIVKACTAYGAELI
ncbi:MAG: hypothetical protein ACXVLT_13375 [Flavisolibacter sp.]